MAEEAREVVVCSCSIYLLYWYKSTNADAELSRVLVDSSLSY
jgi:hypothetical protein